MGSWGAVLEDPDFAYLALIHSHNLQEMYHYTEWYTSLPPLIPIPQRLELRLQQLYTHKGNKLCPPYEPQQPDYTRFYSGSPGSSAGEGRNIGNPQLLILGQGLFTGP